MTTADEDLCLSCGLCCNGTLHNFTYLNQDEVYLAERAGLRIKILRDQNPIFKQPCSAYRNASCNIYAQRPRACRHYECKLLRALQAGEIDLPAAMSYTRQAQQLIASLRLLMNDLDPTMSLTQQVRMNWAADTELPYSVDIVFQQLSKLLHQQFGARWLRRPSRFRRWKRRLQHT